MCSAEGEMDEEMRRDDRGGGSDQATQRPSQQSGSVARQAQTVNALIDWEIQARMQSAPQSAPQAGSGNTQLSPAIPAHVDSEGFTIPKEQRDQFKKHNRRRRAHPVDSTKSPPSVVLESASEDGASDHESQSRRAKLPRSDVSHDEEQTASKTTTVAPETNAPPQHTPEDNPAPSVPPDLTTGAQTDKSVPVSDPGVGAINRPSLSTGFWHLFLSLDYDWFIMC